MRNVWGRPTPPWCAIRTGCRGRRGGPAGKDTRYQRGSFYCHFDSRRELIDAALARWEQENTTALIPEAEAIGDPVERLRHVFREGYEQLADPVEIALVSAVDDPLVAPAVARVTGSRVGFLHGIFIELGLPDGEAADRDWLAYAFYLGHQQLGRSPDTHAVRPSRLDRIVAVLTSPTTEPLPHVGRPGEGGGATLGGHGH